MVGSNITVIEIGRLGKLIAKAAEIRPDDYVKHEDYISDVLFTILHEALQSGDAQKETAWERDNGEWDLEHIAPDGKPYFPVVILRTGKQEIET